MKVPVLATALTVLGAFILCGLGTWQLQRLEWKTELLATLETEYQKDPMQHKIEGDRLFSDLEYFRGHIWGHFDNRKEFLLRPRTYEGTPGYHSFVPFITADRAMILVNRGWVPLDWPGVDQTRTPLYIPITGLFRKPQKPGFFTPKNNPDKDEWYHLDIAAMAEAKGLKNPTPYILYEEGANEPGTYPIKEKAGIHLNNNHLQYAIFWFFMALAMIAVYVLRFLKNPKGTNE